MQVRRFSPTFERLRALLERAPKERLALQADPTSLAPDRVVVFEIAGSVADFARALAQVPGFDLLAEYDSEAPADEFFVERDSRKGHEQGTRPDKPVKGRFYLAVPDMAAMRELVALWGRYERDEPLGPGFAPFRHVFSQLRALRPWGPQDRIPDDTVEYWNEELLRQPDRPVRTEIELWFYRTPAQRATASQAVTAQVVDAGGTMVHESLIPEIAYHGMLVDIPAAGIPALIERREVTLALADQIMFLRPQSVLAAPLRLDAIDGPRQGAPAAPVAGGRPIAALFDGVPLQGHELLRERIVVDDPENLEARALVANRAHGTAMASLILHGDLNANEGALDRPLYVRPVMYATAEGQERSDGDRLMIDTLFNAVVRMKGRPGEVGVSPGVFLVNISLGDRRRPFTRMVTPLARALDFLAVQYGILFLASAGNASAPLDLSTFDSWEEFVAAEAGDRERAILVAMNEAKHERSILSPAESLNALTIGAQHADRVNNRPTTYLASDPIRDEGLPNPSCALGLGYRRMIKPDLFLPGGREHVWMLGSGGGLRIGFGPPGRLFGLSAAAPDPSGRGLLNRTALSDGTSSATALATRAAQRIYGALMDQEGGSAFADMPPEYYALAVKVLLIHRSRWSDSHELLKEICGPADKRRFVERTENVSRFLGFGVPNVEEALACSPNRATLLGFGEIGAGAGRRYRLPLPGSLERVTEPRSVTLTLAWFSPIRPGLHDYRGVKIEAAASQPDIAFGVKRATSQPAEASATRGTAFHEVFVGERAVPFIDDGHLALDVWRRGENVANDSTRYALAVSVEAGPLIPVFQEIQQRLRVRPQPPAA